MSEEKIIDELEEISQMVEGEDTVSVDEELQKIEELTSEEPKEEKKEEKEAAKSAGAAAVAKKATEEKKEEKKEEKAPEKIEEKKPEKPAEKKPTIKSPEKAVRPSNGFLYASALLIIIGLIIYGLAFYLRWNGWRIVNNPPSSAVAIGGTLLILAGGEIYFRGKER